MAMLVVGWERLSISSTVKSCLQKQETFLIPSDQFRLGQQVHFVDHKEVLEVKGARSTKVCVINCINQVLRYKA